MSVSRRSSSSKNTARYRPYSDREKKEEDKKEDYILLGDTDRVCDAQICNNVKYDEDENSDYNNYVFELLNSLVKQHDQQYDESLHDEFEKVVSSPIVRTSNPATPNPLTKMTSSLVKSRSTQKQKIYDASGEYNKYKKFSDTLFTVTEFENRDGRTIVPSQKMSSTNVIDNTKCTLSEQTIEGKNIKLVIERENKYFRHNYPHTPPYQRAIYFKFYIDDKEYFHCTFIISSENDKTYCTSVHYTTRLGGNPVYIYIDLDTIISVFKNDCQNDVIKFLVFLLHNFKDKDQTQKSRKFKCFLGIMACNSGIDAAELQTIINEFTDVLKQQQEIVSTGGKLKNRKKTTTAKPKTTTAKPKTTTAKPKTTTAKPKTTTAKPKTTTAKPKTTTAKPKTTTAKPKTTTSKPKTTTAKPKTTTVKPKTTTAKPKTTTVKPKTTTAKPKTTTAKPKTTTSKSRNPK